MLLLHPHTIEPRRNPRENLEHLRA
jgi:hypothetical protein